MFEIFKNDVKVGDKVKLYLITGKEPEGVVLVMDQNFVVLEVENQVKSKFFDKLIGGWDLIQSPSAKPDFFLKNVTSNSLEINHELLIEQFLKFKTSLADDTLKSFLESNASLIDVTEDSYIVIDDNGHKYSIANTKIFDESLIAVKREFRSGDKIKVILGQKYHKKVAIASTATLPNTLNYYVNIFHHFLNSFNYEKADLVLLILRSIIHENEHLGIIIREFKRTYTRRKKTEIPPNPVSVKEKNGNDQIFKSVEKEINDLIRQSKFDFALQQIELELAKDTIEDKYKSGLLLKKAQIYSSVNNPDASELAYEQLVAFNEKIKSPTNNLSHLYTELARLQSQKIGKKEIAIKSVKRALEYNSKNNFASNLLKQLESNYKKVKHPLDSVDLEEHLLIDAKDDRSVISNMINLDLKEHRYAHPEIIKNGGLPTAYIAQLIIKEARDSGGIKVTENFPLYLEAAKAFSELNIGSYDLTDYLEAVSYYSMLKGNSLYDQYKYNLLNKEIDHQNLNRLNDSACDYYIETLNILSNIDSKSLIVVLTNFLQLKVVNLYLQSSKSYDFDELFNTKFATLFNNCSSSRVDSVKWISIKSIIDIGSNSTSLWNKLNGIFQSEIKFTTLFNHRQTKMLINSRLGCKIDLELTARDFLVSCFRYQRELTKSYTSKINSIIDIEFTPMNFRMINEKWLSLAKHNNVLQETDKETFSVIENLLQIIQPYLNRNDKERGYMLYSVIKKLESQLVFINQNTTFYGRAFFYRLLKQWRVEVAELFEEKIAQSYPLLLIDIDPPYYVEVDRKFSVPLIIKNEGDATAEGYHLKLLFESTEYEEEVEFLFDIAEELPSKGKKELNFNIPPELLEDSNAVELKAEIEALYQKNRLPAKRYEFTVEREPSSLLSIQDIPWRTGNSTPESLFFGRNKLIGDLFNHYLSTDRDKPYILYGLTRTGKSSVLEYLRKRIDGSQLKTGGKVTTYIGFEWELQEISNNTNAREFYNDILYERLFCNLKLMLERDGRWDNSLQITDKAKFTDFKKILEFLKSKDYYPVIFVDEFSYIMDLMNKGTIGKPFLAALREYSLNGLVSFVFAGTYDIRKLITDEKYGITGQLVHVIEYQVDKIAPDDAESLITIIDDKLSFTPEAIDHIKHLSGNIPYFIQIICKNCGDYAVENKRRYIGYPELEKVIQILTGETSSENSMISRLPVGIFQNNQYSTSDPKETEVLISTLCFFNKKNLVPRGIASYEIEEFWAQKGLITFKSKLATSFQSLIDRKILVDLLDESMPVYKFSVDLFRRWWSTSHQDINLEISTLEQE